MSDASKVAATTGRCQATTKSGAPCQSYAGANSKWCFWHDPALAAQRAAARRKGGRARHARKLGTLGDPDAIELDAPGDWGAIVALATKDTMRLENSVSRNRTLGYLAMTAARLFEAVELEARLSALEKLAAKPRKD